jgi:hypothetical protein
MPYEMLPYGHPVQLTQNVVYSLPSGLCGIAFDTALEGAFAAGGPWVAVPGAPGPGSQLTGARFVRCTTANAIVTVYKA